MTAEPTPRRLAAAVGTISIVVPLGREYEDLAARHARLRAGLAPLARPLEFVYVLDGPLAHNRAALAALRRAGEPIEVLAFAHPMGEAAALSVGLRHARGGIVLTTDPDFALDPAELPRLVHRLETSEADLVVGARRPFGRSGGGKLERLLGWLFGCRFEDVRSPVRAMRAAVAAKLTFYGNQHRFLPLIAQAQGFAVEELPIPTAGRDGLRLVGAMGWPSLLLDVATVFFLLRFLEKPFRFFGGFGLLVLAFGGLATGWLIFERLVLGVPLGDRPALILSTLMVVLGIQIIAVGLIGELVTFAWARENPEHRVERIVE